MIKLLTGGGFGDAAMSVGKLYSKNAPFEVLLDNIILTHIEVGNSLLPAIREFYKSQGITAVVTEIPNWDAKTKIRKENDYYLGTHWSEHNVGAETTWEINPFPPLVFDTVEAGQTVVHISSGRKDKFRGFSKEDIIELDNRYKNLIFTGKSEDKFYNEYKFNNKNMVNKTTIKDLVDIICSCEIFIGYAGFALYLAGLANKDVYGIKHWGDGWEYRVHPKWRVKEIKSIKDIL